MLTQESYGTNHEIYVVDSASGKYIYHSQKQYEGINAQNDGILLDAMKNKESGYLEQNLLHIFHGLFHNFPVSASFLNNPPKYQ